MPIDPIKLMRKQVDELLGPNRNGDRDREPVLHYSDRRLCRYDLAGLCPYGLFPNTKQDLGQCPYEVCPVPERWKRQYSEEATAAERAECERELERLLERLVRDSDDRIARANRRLDQQQRAPGSQQAAGDGSGNNEEELRAIEGELEQLTARVEELGEQGEVDEAQRLTERVQELTQRKDAIERVQAMHRQQRAGGKEQQLLVCDVCAAYLSVNESPQRLADHFSGKMHVGLQLVRDKLKELRAKAADGRRRYDDHHGNGGYGGYSDRYSSSRYRSSSGRSRRSRSRSRGRDDYHRSGGRYYGSSSGGRYRGSRSRSRSPYSRGRY